MNTVLGFQVQGLFDPVQTHAVYGVPHNQADEVKQHLKQLGAIRFRMVKNRYGFTIVCFKLKK